LQARSIFINRNYTLFIAGSFVGATGSWIQGVAMGWLALELGNSAFVLGLVGFARMVPLLALAFPVGALADRAELMLALAVAGLGTALVAPGVGWAWLSPAAEGDEGRADAEQQERPDHVGRPLEVARPARHSDRGL
jgi:hypothetical protein